MTRTLSIRDRFNPSFEEHEELQNLRLDCSSPELLETAIHVTQEWCNTDEIAAALRDARGAL
eukprot:46866-Eustigmatos_ZCMA.PRE.1